MIRDEDFRRVQHMLEKFQQEQHDWNKQHIEKMHDQQKAVEDIILSLLQNPDFEHKYESLRQHYQACSGRTVVVDRITPEQGVVFKLQQRNQDSDDEMAVEEILNMLKSQGKAIVSVVR